LQPLWRGVRDETRRSKKEEEFFENNVKRKGQRKTGKRGTCQLRARLEKTIKI
jgi:hypothetical protein